MRFTLLRLALGLVLCAGIFGCSPLITPEQAAAENARVDEDEAEVDNLLAAGEISPQIAAWRRADLAREREQIARDANFYAFDLNHAGALLSLILGGGGLAAGITRVHRGKRRDPGLWEQVTKTVAGSGGNVGGSG